MEISTLNLRILSAQAISIALKCIESADGRKFSEAVWKKLEEIKNKAQEMLSYYGDDSGYIIDKQGNKHIVQITCCLMDVEEPAKHVIEIIADYAHKVLRELFRNNVKEIMSFNCSLGLIEYKQGSFNIFGREEGELFVYNGCESSNQVGASSS